MDSVGKKKRPAPEGASGVPEKPMTKADANPTQPEMVKSILCLPLLKL
jgi:hypothetical protein